MPGQRSSSPKPVVRPNILGAIAPGSGFLTGGKFGENFPSLIKRLCAREK
jgi:hypothetical protein